MLCIRKSSKDDGGRLLSSLSFGTGSSMHQQCYFLLNCQVVQVCSGGVEGVWMTHVGSSVEDLETLEGGDTYCVSY